MFKREQGLTTEQAELIQHLSTGKSFTEAAKLLGISTRTVKRWIELPHVNEAYQAVKVDIATHVREQIKQLSSKAIKALEESLALEDAPTVRLKAAQMVLDRVAPEEVQTQPLQGNADTLIDRALLPYIAPDELETVEHIIQNAEERKSQAESDIQQMERKRA